MPVGSLDDKALSKLFTVLPLRSPFEPILLGRGEKVEMLVPSDGLQAERLASLRNRLTAINSEVIEEQERRRIQIMARSKGVECNSARGVPCSGRILTLGYPPRNY